MYAGTTHLPWKTTDGGATWKSIHQGMIDDSDVFSIHVDSKSPERVYASACSGIYASTSRGEQWRKAQGIPGTDRRTHIVTEDPAYSHLIYAGTTAGLWKSADAGGTWRKLNSHLIRSVEFHPSDGRLMYLATQDRGLLKSMTAGLSTMEINQGFVGRPVQRVAFAGEWMAGVRGRPMRCRATSPDFRTSCTFAAATGFSAAKERPGRPSRFKAIRKSGCWKPTVKCGRPRQAGFTGPPTASGGCK
jgi:hypothetical protein